MAAPISITIIAALFYLCGVMVFLAGLYLLFVVILGQNAIVLVTPLAAVPGLKSAFERLTLRLSSTDTGPAQTLAIAMLVFGLASSFLSISTGLSKLQDWSRTLVIVFCVIGIANGLARLCDPTVADDVAVLWAIVTGISLLILLYLCSPGVAALFRKGEQ